MFSNVNVELICLICRPKENDKLCQANKLRNNNVVVVMTIMIIWGPLLDIVPLIREKFSYLK